MRDFYELVWHKMLWIGPKNESICGSGFDESGCADSLSGRFAKSIDRVLPPSHMMDYDGPSTCHID
jgi:hypothetical protein